MCIPTLNAAAAHPQTASVCLQGRLTGKLVSRQVAKNKRAMSTCAHKNTQLTSPSKGFTRQRLYHKHTHTLYGGGLSSLIVQNQKGSFSFVTHSAGQFKHNQSNVEVFIPLLRSLPAKYCSTTNRESYHWNCLSHTFQWEEKYLFLLKTRLDLILGHNCQIIHFYLMYEVSSKALFGSRFQDRMPALNVPRL